MYLMMKDEKILKFDIPNGDYEVLRPDLLPMKLRDRLVNTTDIEDLKEKYKTAGNNHNVMMDYFSGRVLNLDRENAKKILNAYNFSQSQDSETKTKIALACRIVSMTDDYWINKEDAMLQWKDINPRENSLNKIIAHVALTGSSLTATGLPHTPELTGQGAYAKAWIRDNNGNVSLYKAGSKNAEIDESKIEICVSNILDKTNVPHVRYRCGEFEGKNVCICDNMCNDDKSIVPAEDVISWCNRTGRNFDNYVREKDSENFYKTIVVDYLISNVDRHGQNWGFYMNNHSGQLQGLHPLFDHNNAFDSKCIQDINGAPSLMIQGKSQKEAAMYAIKNCKFRITGEISKEMFPNRDCYDSFMKKACELGIYKEKEKSFMVRIFRSKQTEYELNPVYRGSAETMVEEIQEECSVPEESDSFDDVLKDAREQADRINGQVQEKRKEKDREQER